MQIAELIRPQKFRYRFAVENAFFKLLGVGALSAILRIDHFASHFAADVANLALEIPHARFARIVLDQALQAVIGEFQVAALEPRLLHLLRNEKALGDLQLLKFGIAGEADYFHAVLQRRRNGVQHVGGGDKKDLAQVIFDVQIMIHEHVVLFRI